MRGARRARGEQGASLLLALAFLALTGLLIPAIVHLAGTNLADTSRLKEQRNGVYAADGAVDAAVQYLRENPGCGTQFGSCPNGNAFTATLNGTTAHVAFTRSPFGQLDRTVGLQATLGSDPKVRLSATVIIRDSYTNSTVGNQQVDVVSWTYTH